MLHLASHSNEFIGAAVLRHLNFSLLPERHFFQLGFTTARHSSQVEDDVVCICTFSPISIFTVGEAVRSTCGNSHEKEEKEEKEDHFHLSLHQTIL